MWPHVLPVSCHAQSLCASHHQALHQTQVWKYHSRYQYQLFPGEEKEELKVYGVQTKLRFLYTYVAGLL